MSFETTKNSHILIVSRSIHKIFKIFSVVFLAVSLFIAFGVLKSTNGSIIAVLFCLTLGLLPFVVFCLGRKTLVIDNIKKEIIIFHEIIGFNKKVFFRRINYNENTIIKSQKVKRHGSKGRTFITNQIYLTGATAQNQFILFEILDSKEANNFQLKISQFLGIKSEAIIDEIYVNKDDNSNNLFASALAALFFLGLLSFAGFPTSSKSKIPDGVKTYVNGKYICWDKTVCCNPSDKSTCVTIPTCIDGNFN